jgi:hypothetical protein
VLTETDARIRCAFAQCVAFDTVCSFPQVDGTSGQEAVISLLAHAAEFKEPLYLRHNEKKALFEINSSQKIRFPCLDANKKKSKIKTAAMKASLLLQLRAGGHALGEFHSAEVCHLHVLHAPTRARSSTTPYPSLRLSLRFSVHHAAVGRAHPERSRRVPHARGGTAARNIKRAHSGARTLFAHPEYALRAVCARAEAR